MSSISGVGCPICGDSGPHHVYKPDKLIDWALVCGICGHQLGPGSYWLHIPGGFRAHCESLGWNDVIEEEIESRIKTRWG